MRAINAALALGMIALEDVPGLVRVQNCFDPDAEGAAIYERKYRSYLALNGRLGFNPPGEVIAP